MEQNQFPMMYRYQGHQIALEDQVHDLDFYLPQDEVIQQLLFDMTPSLSDFDQQMTLNSEEEHAKLVFQLKTRCILTDQWNPLIFAIYYGSLDIVKYLID